MPCAAESEASAMTRDSLGIGGKNPSMAAKSYWLWKSAGERANPSAHASTTGPLFPAPPSGATRPRYGSPGARGTVPWGNQGWIRGRSGQFTSTSRARHERAKSSTNRPRKFGGSWMPVARAAAMTSSSSSDRK